MSVLTRLAISVVIAVSIALLARRARALSVDGALAAAIIGTFALLAGWEWGVLLILYFASSSALSRLGTDRKNARTRGIIEKGGERDARQVLANGALFALAAALAVLAPQHSSRWMALGAGALAESASDTWATEIGTLLGGTPRSFTTFAPIEAGMSGGVTTVGTIAAFAGAAFVAAVASALGWPMRIAMASLVGGFVGSTLDSLLGATLQLRRRCDRCDSATERMTHDCGATTRRVGGFSWLGNDEVNLICGAMGGLLALAMAG
ncbi:MAG TPA: DUF92 domain-containing protein [Gemmatimonadaceae bacterium]|nr:DUF92 domain-containing protein [Gemmatimonadaceae bacterium]